MKTRTFIRQLKRGDLKPRFHAVMQGINGRFDNGRALAEHLVERQRLTRWQAAHLLSGESSVFSFGRFLLEEPLGRGASGFVFRATDQLGRNRVLKVLHPAIAANPEALERFRREVRATMRVRHRNVLTAVETGIARGLHFIAFEYYEGIDLKELINRCGRLTPQDTANVISQIALGLQYVAGQGMVHRDVKPSNILVSPDGTARLLDLGLARLDQASSESTVTETGQILGTIDYLPPEQAQDSRYADARSDIYSLGCTMYHCLTGHVPYPHGTITQKLIAHITDTPVPIDDETIPAEMLGIVEKSMAREAGQRFSNAQELAETLAPFRGEDPFIDIPDKPRAAMGSGSEECVSTVPISGDEITLPFLDRETRSLWPAVTAIAVVILLGAAGAAWYLRPDPVGTVAIELSDTYPADAVITVDDAVIESRQFDLPPGQHELEVVCKGYLTFRSTFEIIAGVTTNVEPELEPTELFRRKHRFAELAAEVSALRESGFPTDAVAVLHKRLRDFARQAPTSEESRQSLGLLAKLPSHFDQFERSDLPPEELQAFSGHQGTATELVAVLGKSFVQPPGVTGVIRDFTADGRFVGEAIDIACLPDGSTVAVSLAGKGMVRWRVDDHPVTPEVCESADRDPRSVDASPDAAVFLVGTTSAGCLFQAAGPRRLLVGNNYGRDEAAWSPDGKWLAFALPEDEVIVLDAAEFTSKGHFLKIPGTKFSGVTFSPDSTRVAACTPTGSLHVWTLADESHRENVIETPYIRRGKIAWSPDGRLLAMLRGDTMALIDASTLKEVCWLKYTSQVTNGTCTPAFRPDGVELAVGSDNGIVAFWDVSSFPPVHSRARIILNKRINSVCYTPDGRHILTAHPDGTCCVLRLSDRQL